MSFVSHLELIEYESRMLGRELIKNKEMRENKILETIRWRTIPFKE